MEYYGRAVSLSPNYAFAAANRAVALFEVGRTDEAIRWVYRAGGLWRRAGGCVRVLRRRVLNVWNAELSLYGAVLRSAVG